MTKSVVKGSHKIRADKGFTHFNTIYEAEPDKAQAYLNVAHGGLAPYQIIELRAVYPTREVRTIMRKKVYLSKSGKRYFKENKIYELEVHKDGRAWVCTSNGRRYQLGPKTWHYLLDNDQSSDYHLEWPEFPNLYAHGKLKWVFIHRAFGVPVPAKVIHEKGLYSMSDIVKEAYPELPRWFGVLVLKNATASHVSRHIIERVKIFKNPQVVFDWIRANKDKEVPWSGGLPSNMAEYCASNADQFVRGWAASKYPNTHSHFHDLVQMKIKLCEWGTIDARWSPARMEQEHNAASQRLSEILLIGPDRELKIAEDFRAITGEGLAILDSSKKLLIEGQEMKHCVGSYMSEIESDICAIFSYTSPQGNRYTLEVRRKHGRDNGFYMNQLVGPRNAEAPVDIQVKIAEMLTAFDCAPLSERSDYELPF